MVRTSRATLGHLDRHHALRASVSRGAYTTIGGDLTSVALGYDYAWTRN
jgi:hypothetical protein